MQTFDVISLGEIAIPRGNVPTRFSWEGFFPGEARKDSFMVKDWRSPKELIGLLSLWRAQNTKVRLLVTETPINHDCYIETFDHTWGGGYGDAEYRIELVGYRATGICRGAKRNPADRCLSFNHPAGARAAENVHRQTW